MNEKREGMASAMQKSVPFPSESHMKKPSMQIGLGVALGAGIGAAIAVALGSGGAWLAIGIAVGIVIGLAMSKRKDSAVRNDNRSLG